MRKFWRGRTATRRRPKPAGCESQNAPVERLEPRLFLSATRIAESQAQFYTGPDGAASDGVHAYYYNLDVGGAVIYQTDGTTTGTRKIATLADVDYIPDFRVIDAQLFFSGLKFGASTRHVYAVPADGSTVVDVGGFSLNDTISPSQLAAVGGKAYFIAGRTENEAGIWTSDGTAAGTRLVHAFDDSVSPRGTHSYIAQIGDDLYIALLEADGGWSIQRYDPAADELQSLLDGTGRPQLAYPPTFAAAGSRVIFDVASVAASTELWSTDGTAAGTQSLQQFTVSNLQSAGDHAYFHAGGYQYRTDGTVEGTTRLDYLYFDGPATFANDVYFASGYLQNGLFRVDGDTATLLFDGRVQSLVPVGDRLFFVGNYQKGLGDLQHAVGVTDGTAAGTRLIDAGDFGTQGLQPTAHGVVFSAAGGLRQIDADAPELPSVSGDFFGDWNGDGVRQADESARPWARLFHTEEADYNGHFKFRWAAPGKVDLTVEPTVGFVRPTTPLTRTLTIEEGHDIVDADFGFKPFYSIRGYVLLGDNDIFGRSGVGGQTVYVDLDRDGAFDPDEPSTVSRDDGYFELTDLPIGDVLVRIQPTDGWYATLPLAEGIFLQTRPMNGRVFDSQYFGVSQSLPSNVVTVKLFEDLDRDGRFDEGESSVSGFVWADLDNDGVQDPGEPAASQTLAQPPIQVLRLPKPGVYTIRARNAGGWKETSPPPTVTLGPGERLFSLPIGLDVPAPSGGTIAGGVFHDADGDGVFGAGDELSKNFGVYLDIDRDFTHDREEPEMMPDSLGRFAFVDLTPGHFSIRLDTPTDYFYQTTPAPGAAVEIDLQSGEQKLDLSIGYGDLPSTKQRTIHGHVYDDANGNGVRDAGEGPFQPAYPGEVLRLFLDSDNNGVINGSDRLTVTNSSGSFDFAFLLPGKKRLRLGPQQNTYVVSGFGADGSLVVDVPLDDDPVVEFGVHRANTVLSDPRVMVNDDSRVVVRATVGGFYNAAALRDATRVDDSNGVATPIRQLFVSRDGKGVATLVVELEAPSPASGRYMLTISGAALHSSPALPTPDDFTYAFDAPPPALAVVVGRYVFYNEGPRDGYTQFGSPADDKAIAADKTALLPGESATYANITNYPKGVNGVMIDVAGMPRDTSLAQSDVLIRVGSGGDPSTWRITPAALSTRYGAGVGGSARLTLVWEAGKNVNTWVQVTIKPTNHTGLSAADTFYFGNLVGDGGGDDGNFTVAADDLVRIRNAIGGAPSASESPFDIDHNGVVNAADLVLTRNAVGRSLAAFVAPAGAAASSRLTGPMQIFAEGCSIRLRPVARFWMDDILYKDDQMKLADLSNVEMR